MPLNYFRITKHSLLAQDGNKYSIYDSRLPRDKNPTIIDAPSIAVAVITYSNANPKYIVVSAVHEQHGNELKSATVYYEMETDDDKSSTHTDVPPISNKRESVARPYSYSFNK